MKLRKRPHASFWLAFAGALGLLLVACEWAVPHLIEMAYAGRAPAALNAIIEGRARHTLSRYLESWDRLASAGTLAYLALGALAYLAILFLRSPAGRRRIEGVRGRIAGAMARLEAYPVAGALDLLCLALFCGLTAGLLESAHWEVQHVIGGEVVHPPISRIHTWWMAPIAYALLFTPLAAVLFVTRGRIGRALRRWPIAAFLFGLCAAYAVLRAWLPGLHWVAVVALSAGVTVRIVTIWARRSTGFRLGLRRASPWLAAGLVSTALLLPAAQRVLERRAIARLPEASEDAPSLILIILDTVRAQSSSLYGYERRTTPQLERLSSFGITFERAFAPSPWTLPSHATMFTGQYRHELSVGFMTALDGTFPTLAEVLRSKGYVTAGFVANLVYGRRQTGLARGFVHYEALPLSWEAVLASAWPLGKVRGEVEARLRRYRPLVRKRAGDVNREFLGWLDRRGERPFFAFLNYFDAHDPYDAPRPWNRRFSSGGRYWAGGAPPTPEEQIEMRDAYDNSLAYLDDRIGALYDSLKRRDILDDTWIVVTSDHGEQFGEHGLMNHGNSLYAQLLWVPLLVLPPRSARSTLPPGTRVSHPVTLRDLPATLLALAEPGAHRELPGTPLPLTPTGSFEGGSPILAEVGGPVGEALLAPPNGPLRALVRGDLHYIADREGSEELYDLDTDPEEVVNLGGAEGCSKALRWFRTAIDSLSPMRDRRLVPHRRPIREARNPVLADGRRLGIRRLDPTAAQHGICR